MNFWNIHFWYWYRLIGNFVIFHNQSWPQNLSEILLWSLQDNFYVLKNITGLTLSLGKYETQNSKPNLRVCFLNNLMYSYIYGWLLSVENRFLGNLQAIWTHSSNKKCFLIFFMITILGKSCSPVFNLCNASVGLW